MLNISHMFWMLDEIKVFRAGKSFWSRCPFMTISYLLLVLIIQYIIWYIIASYYKWYVIVLNDEYFIESYDTILYCVIWYINAFYVSLLIYIVSYNAVWNLHIIRYNIVTLWYTFIRNCVKPHIDIQCVNIDQ